MEEIKAYKPKCCSKAYITKRACVEHEKYVCGIQTMKLVIPAEKGKWWMERKNAGIVL